jgi:alkanesulfonate monooxygenase SsuD/methylene tetrahydromethanopterin reductase-like flavin-dependent oxidoreductase (luciferase family)
MDIGVCLPTAVPGASGAQLIEFARRADQLGFHSVTVVDRLVYDNYDGITALAAAAAVTERVNLVTAILLAAYRPSAVELAKRLASLDRLSGGRLVIGISSGMREDDYLATGTDYGNRGRRLDAMIEELREVWKGEGPVPGVGPRPANGDIPFWGGGHSAAALRRAAKYGIGWISPGGPPHKYADLVTRFKELWAPTATCHSAPAAGNAPPSTCSGSTPTWARWPSTSRPERSPRRTGCATRWTATRPTAATRCSCCRSPPTRITSTGSPTS